MRIIKEAENNKKDAPFLGYAKNEGMTNEKQVLALLNIARNKTAKDNNKEQDDFGPEDMAELWKNFKDMIKDNKGKKEESIKEAYITPEFLRIDIVGGKEIWFMYNEIQGWATISRANMRNYRLDMGKGLIDGVYSFNIKK